MATVSVPKGDDNGQKAGAVVSVHPLARYILDNELIRVYPLSSLDNSRTLCISVPKFLGKEFEDEVKRSNIKVRPGTKRGCQIWFVSGAHSENKQFMSDMSAHVTGPGLRSGYTGDEIVLTLHQDKAMPATSILIEKPDFQHPRQFKPNYFRNNSYE